jgi:hypothetical protein
MTVMLIITAILVTIGVLSLVIVIKKNSLEVVPLILVSYGCGILLIISWVVYGIFKLGGLYA